MIDELLARASLRYLFRHAWRMTLAIAGIAIGVAAVVAVDVATDAAMRAFELSIEAVSGRASHRIAGGPAGLDEAFYRRLRVGLDVRDSAPLVEGYVEVHGELLRLLGVDPFAEAPFRDYAARNADIPIEQLFTEPDGVLLARNTSDRLGLEPGEHLMLKFGGRRRRVELIGYLDPGQQPEAAVDGLMISDIAAAQTLLNKVGRLSWIDLKLPDGQRGERVRKRIESSMPPGARIERAQARSDAMAQMTRAFVINLTAMSLLALLVGMFFIYSAMSLSVLQRRSLIANLRTLGVSRGQVFRTVLGEALGLSLVAVLLGLPLGLALGQGLVGLVARTINDLYFTVTVNQLLVDPMTLLKGAALGISGSLVAALGPALEAAGTTPREAQLRSRLERRVQRLAPRLALGGLGLMLFGILLLIPGRSLWLGFTALLFLVMGYALTTPWGALILTRAAAPPVAYVFGIQGRLGVRSLESGLSRTGVALAALVVAVAAAAGVAIMIESFRGSVALWLESALQADVYITAPGPEDNSAGTVLASDLVQRLARVEEVQAIATSYWVTVQAGTDSARLRVIEPTPQSHRGFSFKADAPGVAWAAFNRSQAVLVSEPYAYRHQLQVGDTLRLRTDRGDSRFTVAGIFYDYSSSQGVVVMRRELYDRFWNDHGISSIGVYLRPQAHSQRVLERLRAASRAKQNVLIRSNRELREQSLAIFDRAFAITQVLRLLAVVIAVVGTLSALMVLQLERAREVAIWRAMGFTPGQMGILAIGETALLGLIAGLLAMPLGIIMSLVLIEVINRRAFGWTMQITIAPEALLQPLVLAVAAASLAGVYPAWKQTRARPAEALRAE